MFWDQYERIAIVGSRFHVDHLDSDAHARSVSRSLAQKFVEDFVESLDKRHIVITGACRNGADDWARTAAQCSGLHFIDVRANWNVHKKSAGFLRNPLVVNLASKVLAVWDGSSNGTAHAIRLCR